MPVAPEHERPAGCKVDGRIILLDNGRPDNLERISDRIASPCGHVLPLAVDVDSAAASYGVDPNTLLRVAMCESGLNPGSYNAHSGATGLFQFKAPTFYAHGGHNIWDAADQANVAAKMFSQGLAYEWTCK